mmetsp:Transcript_22641/g.73223  ORF Transcript_22641/g.73223 Transcript_22641/m.73223 type:complete len:231 (-) Transcript_22641:589-1281(-)
MLNLPLQLLRAPDRVADDQLEVLHRGVTLSQQRTGAPQPTPRDARAAQRRTLVRHKQWAPARAVQVNLPIQLLRPVLRPALLILRDIRGPRPASRHTIRALPHCECTVSLPIGRGTLCSARLCRLLSPVLLLLLPLHRRIVLGWFQEGLVRVHRHQRPSHRTADVDAVAPEGAKFGGGDARAEQARGVPQPDAAGLVDHQAIGAVLRVSGEQDDPAAEGRAQLHRVRRQQ